MNEQLLDTILSDCVDYTEGIAGLLHDALEYCDNNEELTRIKELIHLTNDYIAHLFKHLKRAVKCFVLG